MPVGIRGRSGDFGDLGPWTDNLLGWGDTTIELGWYIGMLATEYKVKKQAGEDVSLTVKELYLALKAFDRLDYVAEWGWKKEMRYNGFFIRDDVPFDFFTKYQAHWHDGTYSAKQFVGQCQSYSQVDNRWMAESHDQAWHMFLGWALVAKLVDAGQTYNGENLVALARAGTTRVITYMRSNFWLVLDPLGKKVERGWDVHFLAFGAAEAACKIVNGFTPGPSLCSFHDGYSSNAGTAFRAGLTRAYASVSPDESFKFQVLATIANLGTEYQRAELSSATHYDILPLVNSLLYSIPTSRTQPYYDCLLNATPCDLYNHGGGNYPNFEWSSSSRFVHPEKRGKDPGPFHGEFNGLDYLMLRNLHKLRYGAASHNWTMNNCDCVDARNYPTASAICLTNCHLKDFANTGKCLGEELSCTWKCNQKLVDFLKCQLACPLGKRGRQCRANCRANNNVSACVNTCTSAMSTCLNNAKQQSVACHSGCWSSVSCALP